MLIFKKEKKVAKLVEGHVDKVKECLLMALQTTEAFLDGNIDEAEKLAALVNDLESEADALRQEIHDHLYGGAFLPQIRGEICNLVEGLDKLANAAEACCDLFLWQIPHIPEELKPLFRDVLQTSWNTVTPLREAMRCYFKPKGKIAEIREFAKQVRDQESEVDDKEADLTRKIFRSPIELANKIQLQMILWEIVLVSDRAEDTIDLLELTSLKSVV